jgi:16S rRNA (guanine966-N2)-methyltransferase
VPPGNLPVRPTTDFAKTGLFNLLQSRIELHECDSLDLFSGTGSITMELASRGCKTVTCVDRDAGCIKFIESTAKKLMDESIKPIKSDVFKYLTNCKSKFDLIFADPPFDATYRNELHQTVFEKDLLNANGILVIEHPSRESLANLHSFEFERKYGNVAFSFFLKFEKE